MGVFSTPHGVRGHVKFRSYCENPEDIASYSPLQDIQGNSYTLHIEGQAGDMLIVSVEGITDRNKAENLKNIILCVPRSALPKPKKGEYYHEDLIGLSVSTKEGKIYGTILSVHDFGAGTLVNIRLASGNEEYMPFNAVIFPEIDITKQTCIINPPELVVGDADE